MPTNKRPGRPSLYTPELAERICQRLADGESLRTICASEDMPRRETVRLWLRDNPHFLAMYARARSDQADALWDEAIDKARGANDSASAQCARVFLEATAKLAAKLAPKIYGEKLETDHRLLGQDDKPVDMLSLAHVAGDAAVGARIDSATISVAIMRPLLGRPFKCTACESREVALWLFARQAEAGGWADNRGRQRGMVSADANNMSAEVNAIRRHHLQVDQGLSRLGAATRP